MRYAFDNAWDHAGQRLATLAAWLDPGTIRHLEALGVGLGWHCLEVGAGGGSIAAWLADRVGDSGHVLATDINPRFVAGRARPNLASLRHDRDERGVQRVTMHAEGQFEIASWDQVPYDEGAEGPKLGRATVRKIVRGELAGESTAELLLCGDEQGGIAYTALERVVGASAVGRGPSCLCTARFAARNGRIMPDSGTGELRGLHGTIAIRHDEQGGGLRARLRFRLIPPRATDAGQARPES